MNSPKTTKQRMCSKRRSVSMDSATPILCTWLTISGQVAGLEVVILAERHHPFVDHIHGRHRHLGEVRFRKTQPAAGLEKMTHVDSANPLGLYVSTASLISWRRFQLMRARWAGGGSAVPVQIFFEQPLCRVSGSDRCIASHSRLADWP